MNALTHYILYCLGAARPYSFYGSEEYACLEKYAAGKHRPVEIGCWMGVNTCRIRRVMAEDGILFAVDPYAKGRLGFNAAECIAHREVRKISNGSVRWLALSDVDAAALLSAEEALPFDFIFSDSLNSYDGFKNTWNAWKKLLADDGIYILANSRPSNQKPIGDAGSVAYTKEILNNESQFELVEQAGCFTVLQRRKT